MFTKHQEQTDVGQSNSIAVSGCFHFSLLIMRAKLAEKLLRNINRIPTEVLQFDDDFPLHLQRSLAAEVDFAAIF